MESIALNDTIVNFLKPKITTCGLELSGFEALELLKTNPYLVILNQHRQPQGLFTTECVCKHYGQSLAELDLQPLPAIADQTTVREFLDRLCQYDHSASIWAVVDRRNQYLGVIEVLSLIRRVAQVLNHQALHQFTTLIEQLPFPVSICDHKYGVVGANELWQQEFGSLAWRGERLITSQSKSQQSTWQITQTELSGDLSGLWMAIAQDITAQEHLAKELSEQNIDLVKLNRIKDEFIACISHELKTPLTSVIGMASLLSTETIGDLNERQKRYVSMIHQNGRHLTFMIDNVMDLAKAETGQLELYPDVLSIGEICQQSILKTHKLLQQDNNWAKSPDHLDIDIHIDAAVDQIIADGMRLQQMLVNLLSNAIKFTESIPQVKLSVQMWEGWIAICVSDRGIGIPQDKQHLIFQKFQQLENILTRKYDGVGLGLVLTRHLARLHGGDVTFISEVGKGSEFTILLPPAPPHLLNVPEQIRNASSKLVLVVEHIPEDISHVITVLGGMGYRSVVARSGTEALEKARKLQPSFICLSPDLPVLSGWDVLSLLKKDPATATIKVLVTLNDSANNLGTEADWYIPKPIQSSDLEFLKAIAPTSLNKLTILHIGETHRQLLPLIQGLECQVLTATDISQGEILGKIWQPKLVLLDYAIAEASTKLKRISRSILKNLPILLIHELGMDQKLDQKFLEEEISIYTKFTNLNLYFLNQLTSIQINKAIQKATGNQDSATIGLCDFSNNGNHDQLIESLFQYLLISGFKPYIFHEPSHISSSINNQNNHQNIDLLVIKLNSENWKVQSQIFNRLKLISVPIIIINESNNPLDLDNFDLDHLKQKQIPVTVLPYSEAIALLIPTLEKYICK
ncbi:signal transduction histidine kinase [Synechococcus sp. PCC 7502]|uniref:ATP-binding response regulator n=1 Tax=Synechococcus sp. PCC 7502 TaxID=1173263 RepID=UPI00029FD450|nr:hybrid sensor histidine kinase/response regulator [Synechococcus sp. PCC 7502]AFY72514.1 signal transduction histidine kinase [Synechococcus sp. PCC 7502]